MHTVWDMGQLGKQIVIKCKGFKCPPAFGSTFKAIQTYYSKTKIQLTKVPANKEGEKSIHVLFSFNALDIPSFVLFPCERQTWEEMEKEGDIAISLWKNN